MKKLAPIVLFLFLGLALPAYWLLSRRDEAPESEVSQGTRVLYRSSRESERTGLFVYDQDVKTATRIPEPGNTSLSSGADYSIKAGVMAYVAGAGPKAREIYVGPIGGQYTKIHTADTSIHEVELSPDLKQIAYVTASPEIERAALWKIDADGSDNVRVASPIPSVFFMEWLVADRIYFAELFSRYNEQPKGLLSIDVTSGAISKLPVPDVAVSNVGNASFTHDGSRVVITTGKKMYVADIEQLRTQELPSSGGVALDQPVFSLDNAKVAYVQRIWEPTRLDSDIFLFDTQSGESTILLDEPAAEIVNQDEFLLVSHGVADIAGWVSDGELIYVRAVFENDEGTMELILLDTVSKEKTLIDSAEEIEVLGVYNDKT